MSWYEFMDAQKLEPYFLNLQDRILQDRQIANVFPPEDTVLNAFHMCPFNKVRVIIIGQDPYHTMGLAHGLAFSVERSKKLPPSLRNIFKELLNDTGINRSDGNLSDWAEQGILLLNTILTVREGKPNSHKGWGWEKFTDRAIEYISKNKTNIIFILWGRNAQNKKKLIDQKKHHVITGSHPSPLGANKGGFFHTNPFSECNNYLDKKIMW